MKTGSIYIIKNKVNGKVYIGQTAENLSVRFGHHLTAAKAEEKTRYKLYVAINEIGVENFYIELVEDKIPLSELDDKEREYIAKYDSYRNGYNQTSGGKGGLALSEKEINEVIELFNSGATYGEIAKKYGVHKATIERTLHSRGYRKYVQHEEEIMQMACTGMSNESIAKEIGCDPYTVCRSLQRQGVRKHRQPLKCREDFDYDGLRADYENQMPIKDICKKYDISQTVLRRTLEQIGVPLRPQIYKNKVRYKKRKLKGA